MELIQLDLPMEVSWGPDRSESMEENHEVDQEETMELDEKLEAG